MTMGSYGSVVATEGSSTYGGACRAQAEVEWVQVLITVFTVLVWGQTYLDRWGKGGHVGIDHSTAYQGSFEILGAARHLSFSDSASTQTSHIGYDCG